MISTWFDLADYFCARKTSRWSSPNPYFEPSAARRYNYAPTADGKSVRLVFLRGATQAAANKTLGRKGRFIWCKNLRYEGTQEAGLRQISFTIGKGQKRFTVCEGDVLCLPSSVYVNNNSFMRNYDKVFGGFSSVFCYDKAVNMMFRNELACDDLKKFQARIQRDCSYKVGALVTPRLGYFMPDREKLSAQMEELCSLYCAEHPCEDPRELASVLSRAEFRAAKPEVIEMVANFLKWSESSPAALHPYGIILGRTRETSGYSGRELYRVNFGGTIYEKVHPAQMEVVSEV